MYDNEYTKLLIPIAIFYHIQQGFDIRCLRMALYKNAYLAKSTSICIMITIQYVYLNQSLDSMKLVSLKSSCNPDDSNGITQTHK